MSDRLLVFVKAPRPGAVKTRLAAVLGDEGAAGFYRVLAEEEIRRTAPRAGEYDRTFFFTPEDARPEIERWLPGEASRSTARTSASACRARLPSRSPPARAGWRSSGPTCPRPGAST